jgi:hypothetical protein
MATESIGALIPTAIPGYSDSADIQAALRAYHYGSYAYDPANTSPASLVTPSIAKTIYDIQQSISGVVTLDGIQTLTNKTLTSPTISGLYLSDSSITLEGSSTNTNETVLTVADPSQDNTITFPNSSGAVVLDTLSQTLTNKTINLSSNTLTATSAQVAAAVTDETGSGSLVFGTSPTIATPVLSLSTSSSTTDARISWDTTNKVLQVGNGSTVLNLPTFLINTIAKTGAYPLVLGDQNTLIQMNGAFAFTVPLNSTQAFPIGTQITILQTGAGQTTILPTTGVIVNATPGLKLRAQWSSATLIKRATNTWVAIGDLTT